jgi:CBS domain-containing protein
MADRWNMPLDRWRNVFRGWVDRPEPQALVEAEVFLDFRRVYGSLSTEPLEPILRWGGDALRFLVGMARAAVRFRPPLGWTGRVQGDQFDLKRGGLAAVVLLARLYALAAGSSARATLDRLVAAAEAQTLSRAGADGLAGAYSFLADLRLGVQLRQLAAGAEPTNRVRMSDLTAEQRGRLRRALYTVRDVQQATALRFHTETVL